jgi:subtilisin family serine protease
MGSEERRRRHVARFISATVLGAALAASVTLTGAATLPAGASHMSSNSPPAYQDGVVLVGFDKSTSQQQQVAEVAGAGATDTRTIGVGVHILHVPPGQVLSAVRRLGTQPGIRYAEPDYIEYESGVPNDPSFGLEWGYQNTGQTVNNISGTPGADERAVQAWNITTGSRSIVIGEADTGVDYTHPDLAANIWSNPGGVGGCAAGTHGYNVISSTCDPMDDDTVYGGHGTHVAGILGAVGNNGIGVTGVNWTTTILPVKWVGSSGGATTSNLIIGLDWLLKAKQAGVNVRVVNDSNTLCCPSQALSDEIDLLGGNGILFVTAASNFGANNDDPALRRYPCGFERPTEICVTATNQQDQLPTWANYGPTTVDLAAPGDNVYSTLRNATYGFVSGSSMASPQVAGAAALILSVQEMSPQALKADILENVDPLSSLSGLVRTGGRLDICRAVPGCTQSSPPALFNVTPPSISGFTQLGQTLTATAGDWTGGPTSYTYQWRRCSSSGSSCANVAGATSASYQLVGADVGSTMQVAVTATKGTNTVTGYSPPSSVASNVVTPATVPGTPTNVTATAGDSQATVSWTAPDANGSAITGFTVTSSPGGLTATAAGNATSTTVGGLTNGTAYTFTVTATNAAGTGPSSAPSNVVTPALPTVSSVVPNIGPIAGGTSVTITGTNLTGATAVKFGTVAATTYTVNSATQITATSPAGSGIVDVTVTTAGGTSATSAADQFTYTPAPAAYTAVTPVRLTDTRSSGGPLGSGGSRNLTVAGVTPGAPAGATAVVLNVTVTNTTAASYLTVYPAGATQPLASNLNWVAGKTVPNLVEVPVGSGGAITIYNAFGSSDVVVDLEGYYAAPSGTAGGEVALTPARIADTRAGSGEPNAGSTLAPGSSIDVQVTGAGGVPTSGVSGAILNVTVTNTTASSFLSVWPSGQGRPLASNLNWVAGQTVPNRVFVPVSATGRISVYNQSGSADVVVDVSGYFTDATATGKLFTPASPLRLIDTRSTGQTLGPAGTFTLQVGGLSGVPSGASAVILNVTVTNTTAPSFLTVYPSTGARPPSSDLNWVGGQTVPNLVVVTLGTTGAVTFYNAAGSTDVVVDLAGWYS